MYKGPTLRGSDAQIEDQSYEHTMHVQSSNPMGRCMTCVIIIRLVYCVPHVLYVSVVHTNMPYDGVQVYTRNNSSMCTSAGDCVSQHGCMFMYYA